MLLKNNDRREHAVFNCGYTYTVQRGKTVEIPDGIAQKMMRRYPKLEVVTVQDDKQIEADAVVLEVEMEMAENNVEMEGSEEDEEGIDEILA